MLPDGQTIELGNEMWMCTEALFDFQRLGLPNGSLLDMVYDCIMTCSMDTRRDLYSNIVFTGGNTFFQGMETRAQNEMALRAPASIPIRTVFYPERKFSPWIGGSILATVSTFQPLWGRIEEWNGEASVVRGHGL